MCRSHALRVWHAARDAADLVIAIVADLPRSPATGLRAQLVRSARSVSNNIAEGAGRGSTGEKLHFFRLARGSVEETQDHIRELVNSKHIDKRTFFKLWNRYAVIDRMLAKNRDERYTGMKEFSLDLRSRLITSNTLLMRLSSRLLRANF